MLPPPDLVLEVVGFGVLIPAVVTAVGLLLALRRGNPRGGDALAVGAGLLAGFAALAAGKQLDWDFLRPADSWDWLPLLAVAALVAGVVDRLPSLPTAGRWGLRLAVAGLTAWLLVRAESAVQTVSLAWYAGLALAVLALWGLLDPLTRSWPGAGPPGLLALVVLAAGGILELAGILTFALMAGVLAAVLGGCAGVGGWWSRESPARAATPALAVLLPGLLFAGYLNTFSDVPTASFLLVLAAPLLLGATAWLPLSKLSQAWLRTVQVGATLVPLTLAVALAALA